MHKNFFDGVLAYPLEVKPEIKNELTKQIKAASRQPRPKLSEEEQLGWNYPMEKITIQQ